LILDLSRIEVVEYLFERIDSFLSCGDIDYVKWDMNRVMTEVGSAGLAPELQLETPHRYILGMYDLVSRLTTKHSHVLFENCASGGNRFDLGMLNYMSQSWLSDMSEPIGRLPIMNSASYLYPPSIMASYIGPIPGHQNDRTVSIKTRAEVGFFCAARGLSLNLIDIEKDEPELREVVELYKATAQDVVNGSFYRLRYTDSEVCWQLASADERRIYIGYFHILSAPNLPFRRIKLCALDADANYSISGCHAKYAGNALMNMGLDLPYVHAMQSSQNIDYMDKGDFSSRLIVLKKD
jgi:alpha-galactosidase